MPLYMDHHRGVEGLTAEAAVAVPFISLGVVGNPTCNRVG
jgi:hypothetical protein